MDPAAPVRFTLYANLIYSLIVTGLPASAQRSRRWTWTAPLVWGK
ncbi:hypothetical protein KNP414_06643 [Paenibacillus mucilaginosus KNP414]|uniref:Uncharacterized protein n=1 Tax=Paenibacillus mucilaginosus (strain KNP414) TaxID=1036673 RepID=F8F9W5_PAEMK|nr:hypothetical protein KNP414_06643 [Paenibacillus mucilaginosus KNP414]